MIVTHSQAPLSCDPLLGILTCPILHACSVNNKQNFTIALEEIAKMSVAAKCPTKTEMSLSLLLSCPNVDAELSEKMNRKILCGQYTNIFKCIHIIWDVALAQAKWQQQSCMDTAEKPHHPIESHNFTMSTRTHVPLQ